MKVLLDECVDRRLAREFPNSYEISTVYHVGWSGVTNGKLLALAVEQFDAFLTVDQNLSHQQNLKDTKLVVLILHSNTHSARISGTEIVDGIYLVQSDYELDLHNNFDFKNLNSSVEERILILNWVRSKGDWVGSNTPKTLSIEYIEVSEFRFMPRDSKMPFTEDDCINSIGCWVLGR